MINVVLYNPEIPQNTGNIMRTCAATKVRLHLIKPLGFSLEEKYVRRSGANYIDHTDTFVYDNWSDFIGKNHGDFYFLTRYGMKSPDKFDFSNNEKNIYLVFGSESSGIPKEILKGNLDNCLRLPMTKEVRSLNLSNVVAVLVYEVLRQQDYNDLISHEPDELKGRDYLL